MDGTKVMIVEKDMDFLNSLLGEINKHPFLQVVAVATSSGQIINELKNRAVDLVLMDIDSNETEKRTGIEAITDIRESNKNVRIIILSSVYSENWIAESIFAGADCYVLKKHIARYMGEAGYWLGEKHSIDIIIYKFREMRLELLKSRLTHAEKEVFELLNTGFNQREISQKLFKSGATIKKQVKGILVKFEVGTTKELLKKVRQTIYTN